MSLNKGELLSIKSDELNTSSILKKKVFVLPIDKSIYKIGATFEWNWENENPSKEKKNILISQFKEISTSKFEVINHEAGVRPSVKDRRPIIGLHKKHRAIGVFNGLGSRGCFSAPLLAEEFLNYLECNTDLNNETKIERYYNI